MGYVSFVSRRRLAAIALVAVFGASATGAGADSTAPLDDLPSASVLATNGQAVEAILDDVGLDAAWRAATGLGPIARGMVVEYTGDDVEAVSLLLETAFELRATTNSHADVVRRLRRVALQLNDAREDERDRTIERNQADAHFRGTHALMASVALDLFAGGDPAADALFGLDGEALTAAQRTHELTSHTLEEMLTRRQQADSDLADAIAALDRAITRREALEATHTELAETATALAGSRRRLEAIAREILPGAAADYALAAVPHEPGMTPRALEAYVNAEVTMAELSPRCAISWRTIAAVGSVEGKHGSHGDRRIDMDAVPDRPIIGVALDGVRTDNYGDVLASIPDTDGGRYDGDVVHDRAVGPMQFIPQTWQQWKHDGDGDGTADPQDLDDAALAAAAYLCDYGSLRTWADWNTAIFGYNHSVAYVTSVKVSLDRVARIALPEVDEVGDLELPRPRGTWVPPPQPIDPEPEADSVPAG